MFVVIPKHSASLALGVSFALLLFAGCNSGPRDASPVPSRKTTEGTTTPPLFDQDRSFGFLKAQVDFGPRNPGSSGYQRCLSYLQTELRKQADSVWLQTFPYRTHKGEVYQGNNVIARFKATAANRVLLSAHWDTRAWADMDPDPKNHTRPIPGANDGASGVAVLLEIAQHLRSSPPSEAVDIVLFDAEDVGRSGDSESYAQGSQYFARNLPSATNYRFAINLDMVGDKNLEIRRENNSESNAPGLMDQVFSTARLLGFSQFIDEHVAGIYDDHMPLNNAGIPAIDLIDFNYPDESNRYWHTMEDTVDKCSPESLRAVGTVLLNILYGQGTGF